MKKFIGIILTLTILFSLSSEVFAFDNNKVNATLESVGNYLYKTVKEPQVKPSGQSQSLQNMQLTVFSALLQLP